MSNIYMLGLAQQAVTEQDCLAQERLAPDRMGRTQGDDDGLWGGRASLVLFEAY